MKRRVVISIAAFALIAIAVGIFVYWKLTPDRYFSHKSHPVIALPAHIQSEGVNLDLRPLLKPRNTQLELPEGKHEFNTEYFNVLLLGVDAKSNDAARSDVVMVAHVDLKKKHIQAVSIPRDTQIELPKIGRTKLNHAHWIGSNNGGSDVGIDTSIAAVSALLNIPIHYHVTTNFEGFVQLVDLLGGVEVDLSKQVRLDEKYANRTKTTILPAGKQTLDGVTALDFIRERYSLPNGDFDRQSNQMMVLKSLARKATKPLMLPKLPKILADLKREMITTNFTNNDLISLAWLFSELKDKQITYFQLEGYGAYAMDEYMRKQLYFWIPNRQHLREISQSFAGKVM